MSDKRHFLLAAGAAALAPWVVSARTRPAGLATGGPYPLPNFMLETHQGRRVRFYDDLVKDKIVLFNMMYTSCTGICPPNTARMLLLQEALGARMGRDIFMYSLTLRPEFDSPQELAAYVQRYGIGPGWTFLTGKPAEMDLIRRSLGFYSRDPAVDADLSQHTGMLRIGHERYRRWIMAPVMGSLAQTLTAIRNL